MGHLVRYQRVEETPRRGMARVVDAIRSYWGPSISPRDPQLAKEWGLRTATATGVPVNEQSVLTYSAARAAVSLIADDVASLPLMLYKRLPNGGKERFKDHPLYRLLHDQPNPEMTSMELRRTLQAHVLLWGNGYAEIERDGAGRPAALWPITPDRVRVLRSGGGALLRYHVQNPSGSAIVLDHADVIHLHGLGFDGAEGYNVVAQMRESIGLALGAEQFGAAFFGNGATFGGVVSFPSEPTDLAKKNLREALERRHQGVSNAHRFLMLFGGAKFEPTGVPPDHAQFQELRTFQIREVARWFKVPPHLLGDMSDATYSNVEQQNLAYFTSCLRPILVSIEQELSTKLIAPLERKQQFIEHVTEGFLRADAQGRAEMYSKLFAIGAITINEIRERENLDPVKGGDEPLVPLNMTLLGRLNETIDANLAAKKPAPAPAPTEPMPTPDMARMASELDEARWAIDEHIEARGRIAGQLTAAQTTLEETRAAVTAAEAVCDALTQERDGLRQREAVLTERLAASEQTARAAEAERDRIGGECVAANERRTADADLHRAERDALVLERADSQQQHAVLTERLAASDFTIATLDVKLQAAQETYAGLEQTHRGVCDELARAHAQLDGLSLDVTVEQAATAKAAAECDIMRSRAETAEQARAASDATVTELRRVVETQVAEVTAADTALSETAARVAGLDATLTESRAAATRAEAEAATARAVIERRTAAFRVAMRPILTETWRRLITRETDRARKMQASPEKLTRWAADFYPQHQDVCRTALLPVTRAWLALMDAPEPLDQVVDETVTAYIDESLRTIRGLTAATDLDTLAPALEQTLRRWETERADAATDRMMREGSTL